jgi:type II secretory ATPase GspE/PulE/Tfp pilus assembly ATPase PilB-like protein
MSAAESAEVGAVVEATKATVPPGRLVASRTLDEVWARLDTSSARRASHLGEALIERGLVEAKSLALALQKQAAMQAPRLLGQLLVEDGVLPSAQLDLALADWLGVPSVDLAQLTPEPEALDRIPRTVALHSNVLPLMVREHTLVVAMADPWDQSLVDELRFVSDLHVLPVMATSSALATAVPAIYAQRVRDVHPNPTESDGSLQGRDVQEMANELASAETDVAAASSDVVSESDNALVRLINSVIGEAIRRGASDIHVETADAPANTRIRMRVDGELLRLLEVPARYRFAMIARLKIMAELDISEHRKPQDGKIDFARFGGPHVELRMVTVPTSRGLEDVVLRLLSGLKPMPLDDIGLSAANLARLRSVMAKPYGLILVCGPTGCGKTTTLHSVMRELNTEKRKIWTAEDPVEITQEGLRQVQVNPRTGWTFAAAMRTFLRADPDIIMIGEMRDEETASIAVEASLTGHLVMSTLHTNSAPESITRLLEIGLDPFTFSDSLLGILAQRLVRRLCSKCRTGTVQDERRLSDLADAYLASSPGAHMKREDVMMRWRFAHGDAQGNLRLYQHVGCEACGGSGYRGRVALHELMLSDEAVRELVRHRAPASDIQTAALGGGMVTLRQDGIEKALAGITDIGEVLAATNA